MVGYSLAANTVQHCSAEAAEETFFLQDIANLCTFSLLALSPFLSPVLSCSLSALSLLSLLQCFSQGRFSCELGFNVSS